jgi:hypothetical protein
LLNESWTYLEYDHKWFVFKIFLDEDHTKLIWIFFIEEKTEVRNGQIHNLAHLFFRFKQLLPRRVSVNSNSSIMDGSSISCYS